jgi:hypothetical protein
MPPDRRQPEEQPYRLRISDLADRLTGLAQASDDTIAFTFDALGRHASQLTNIVLSPPSSLRAPRASRRRRTACGLDGYDELGRPGIPGMKGVSSGASVCCGPRLAVGVGDPAASASRSFVTVALARSAAYHVAKPSTFRRSRTKPEGTSVLVSIGRKTASLPSRTSGSVSPPRGVAKS